MAVSLNLIGLFWSGIVSLFTTICQREVQLGYSRPDLTHFSIRIVLFMNLLHLLHIYVECFSCSSLLIWLDRYFLECTMRTILE